MTAQAKDEKLHAFFINVCVSFVAGIRALSLYPPEHPETRDKVGTFLRRLSKYLEQRPTLTMLFFDGEVVVENVPLPELSGNFSQLIERFEAMKLQHLIFRRGVDEDQVVLFLQVLLPLMKNPSGADLVMAKNQEKLPHILAGSLPFDGDAQPSYEDLSGALQTARKTVLSFSAQLKGLFSDLEGPLPADKVALAKEITEAVRGRNLSGELPVKLLLFRRSPDPDPYIHAVNVASLSMVLAHEMGLQESGVQEVGLGALLHDIGLHLSSSASLSKTAAISLDEKKIQWEHPVRGAEILMATPGMPDLVPLIAYEHHLQYDGHGYPEQKRPRDLNLASMIAFIANTYDNLRRNRPEQDALSLADSLNWMDRRIGTYFHPLLLKKFRAFVKAQTEEGF